VPSTESVAAQERAELADLLAAEGPDQPTLCGDWTTRDLAAHVVLRERRPVAALGIALPPLAGHTRHVQDDIAASTPWPELVEHVRRPSPLLLGPSDEWVNTTEMFVHLEDVRRAQEGWQPRPTDARREATMWRVLRQRGRWFFRRAGVGVRLELPDGREQVARDGTPYVTVRGPATEILLFAHGRAAHARVELLGDPAAISALRGGH